jgi:cytochrome c oxidase cbb3-type subunit 3
MKKSNLLRYRLIASLLMLIMPLLSTGQTDQNAPVATANKALVPFDIDTALFFIAVTLAFVILILVGLLRSAIKFHFNSKKWNDTMKFLLPAIIITMSYQLSNAQQSIPAAKGSAPFLFSTQGWFMLIVIVIELYVLFSITKWLKQFTGIQTFESGIVKKSQANLWDKINAFKPMESEASIDVGHDYDGIRELDNITPPWFVAAFAGTILFAAVYLYRYHVAYSAPSQIKEYEIAVKEAELRKLEDLKSQANFVDENTVTLLKEGEYEEGKTIFKATCAVCHGNNGQGLVGPNMTDDYWIHGGSIKDIFTTIKYGVLDKGMKSWKDDYSPNQIAQLASYIKSLRGTNPPDQKAPQGDLYKEVPAPVAADTTKMKTDSSKTNKR